MRIRELKLKKFGPFQEYTIPFVEEESACLLFTGKNNEGKTSIISALRLLDAASRVIEKRRQEIILDGTFYYKLYIQDVENLNIGRMVYNYQSDLAEIHGTFSDGFRLSVFLDPKEELVYADYRGRIPADIQEVFGFIPPLGPLSEEEDIISNVNYLRANLKTSLAPRHLRNHFYQILTPDEFQLVKEIINSSWQNVELLGFNVDRLRNQITCIFKEGRIDREISWAGQGLQIWFQIITHLVRLRNSSVIILDEPEINLHPEKQNDLIRIIKDHFNGSIIIATHSVELMNNVSVSHIVNVQKAQKRPVIKKTNDRAYLELVRAQVGSNFNLVASQFEEFDLIIFTEDVFDFFIVNELAGAYRVKKKAYNIPLHGFNEYAKAIAYKNAYEMLIGKNIDYTLLLDRDYYPEEFLLKIKRKVEDAGIRVIFTPGKEIENILISPDVTEQIIPQEEYENFMKYWNRIYKELYLECQSNFLSMHTKLLDNNLDTKTVIKEYSPQFNAAWNDKRNRHNVISGKDALKRLRAFCQKQYKKNVPHGELLEALNVTKSKELERFILSLYHEADTPRQKLHY